jgi:cysteine-rich repeat protein
MPHRYPPVSRLIAVVFLLAALAGPLAQAQIANDAQARSLAGQMCPQGAYVIGFDGDGNIVCSHVCGNGVLDAGERCDDGNTRAGDGCSAACQLEDAPTPAAAAAPVAQQVAPVAAAAAAVTPMPAPALAIADVEPSSVVFGSREVTLTISGAGFHSGTTVLFDGSTYQPSVNQAGTELQVTLPTRRLAIGRYPIKLSNGPDEVVKWSKPLVVF